MKYRLQDLIDIDHFQNLQDRLNKIYSFPSSIIDIDGNILTATAWQDVCTKFHRKNKEAERICIKSDRYIASHIHEASPAVSYRCPHGLVDNATPIIIDGIHYGNFFTGQFFLEEPDLEFFQAQAKKYGFDEEAYIEAIKKVPIWTQEQLDNYLYFIKGLIAVISESGLKKLREIENRKQIQKSEKRYRSILKAAIDGYWLTDTDGRLLEVNDAYVRMSGYSENELLTMHIHDLEVVETPEIVAEHMQKVILKGSDRFESKHRRKDGTVFDVEVSIQLRPEDGGQCVCFLRDITDLKRADISLRKSEEKYRKLYEDAAIGIFHSNFDGQFLDVNPALARMLGYETPQDVVDSIYSIAEQIYVEPQDRDEVIGELLSKGETIKVENRYRRRDGSDWNAYLYLRCVFDSNGQPVCLEGFVEDITDRKRVEEALKESRTFLENMTDVAYITDDRGNIVWVNPAAERVTGLPPEEIIGKPFLPLFIEADHASLMDVYKRTLAGESLENTLTLKSGVICHFTSLPKRDSQGDITGTFGIGRDISERLATEKALRTNEARLKKAQAMAKVGNWEYDIATRKVWGSEEAFRIYGIERTSEFLPLDIVEDHIIDAEIVSKALVDLIAHNKTYDIEFQIQPKTREGLTHIHSMADLVCDEDGKPVKVVGVIQDITENKCAEIEREELREKLRQAQKMESVGRLAGGVAHDFNNMLSLIIGHADMAMEEVDPSMPLYERLEEIRKAGERSADLTRQLLAFARKQTVAPKVIDLNKTIEGMTRMLKRLIGEDIDLAWLPRSELWPVKMDPSQIDQILANMCVNARDAIADVGKVTIETDNAVFDETFCADHPGFIPGEYVLLAISDNGCGMDAETLDKIFEPFFTTKEFGVGTGLGLATVYGVVKQNNGFVNVYSEPNQGTTFKIYLPRYRTKADFLPEKEKDLLTEQGHETILLVEDEAAILKMTTIMLERMGYQVLAARTPGEAIRLAREYVGEIHLLVTDVVMPEMNGRDLAKNILSIYPNLERLFMSGYTANVIAHRGVLDEGVNFIQKPFSREQLGAKLREVLDRS